MNLLIEVITAIRNMRSELQISPAKKLKLFLMLKMNPQRKYLNIILPI